MLEMEVKTGVEMKVEMKFEMKVDMKVEETLVAWDEIVTNSEEVIAAAKGALVCPKISKVGLGIGLEGGKCALIVGDKTHSYWKASSASFPRPK